ncbi:hypothetical protein MW887_007594 [Aspergillus wentii]|nr:hypothetical protein MW887_007594 [Aspergillus wentii]
MDSIVRTVGNLLPYHMLSYGTLLGTEVYQSFVNTKLCYKHLPMREFITLQKRIFPVYFNCQLGLVILTALTRPPYSVVSLAKNLWDAAPLVIIVVTGALNRFVYGPRTTKATFVRRALQESSNNETGTSGSDPSKLQQANRAFSFNHAMTIHLNAISVVATVWYAFSLSSSISSGL